MRVETEKELRPRPHKCGKFLPPKVEKHYMTVDSER